MDMKIPSNDDCELVTECKSSKNCQTIIMQLANSCYIDLIS